VVQRGGLWGGGFGEVYLEEEVVLRCQDGWICDDIDERQDGYATISYR